MNGEGEKQSYRLIFEMFFGGSDALNKIYRKKWPKILVVQKSSLPLQRNCERALLKRENSSVGRARPCQGRGRGFESRFSLKSLSHFPLSPRFDGKNSSGW